MRYERRAIPLPRADLRSLPRSARRAGLAVSLLGDELISLAHNIPPPGSAPFDPLAAWLAGPFLPIAPSIQPRDGEVLPVEDRQPGRPYP